MRTSDKTYRKSLLAFIQATEANKSQNVVCILVWACPQLYITAEGLWKAIKAIQSNLAFFSSSSSLLLLVSVLWNWLSRNFLTCYYLQPWFINSHWGHVKGGGVQAFRFRPKGWGWWPGHVPTTQEKLNFSRKTKFLFAFLYTHLIE